MKPHEDSTSNSYRRPYTLHRQESLSELSRMNNLNSRFMNFLDLVKSETKRSDDLKTTLNDQKQEIVSNLRENTSKYHDDLMITKKFLNDITYSLNKCQVTERSNRIRVEWFSRLLKFELDNLNQRPKLNVTLANNLNFQYQLNQVFEANQSMEYSGSSNEVLDLSLSTNSQMSSSQTSLSSMSCISSHSSSSASETSETVSPQAPNCYITDTQIQLESYLSNTKSLRTQLESDYERQVVAIFESKDKVDKLSGDVFSLNNELDSVKTDNYNLSENLKNLKKELEFYRKLNVSNERIRPHINIAELKPKNCVRAPSRDDPWFVKELEKAKMEAIQEFELFNKTELNAYEEQLEKKLLSQLEEHELEFNAEADRIDAESDSILDELTELNAQLNESVEEYGHLSKENQILTERLISLSNNLVAFNQLPENDQDCLIVNFSIKTLERQITSTKADVKAKKKELSIVKSSLIQKDIIDLLEPNERCLINPKTNPWLNLSTLNPSSLIMKQHYSDQKSQHDLSNNQPQQKSDLKYELNIRPYSSQIEYTKSNLFAFLKLDFDLTRNYYTVNSKHLNTNLNCLRIAVDSIDGHSIVLENSHKILDFDLSEWTIRREIQNCPNFELLNVSGSVNVPFKIPVEGEVKLVHPNLNANNSKLVDIIEFKFPKGFKLKRRKKVNLIAAGVAKKQSTTLPKSQSGSNINSTNSFSCNSLNEEPITKKKTNNKYSSNTSLAQGNTFQSITMNKCACCSCKMLTTRQGDIDIFEVKEVPNWGTGLLVVTKFINNKNITKLVNYKCLKHIWVNDSINKNGNGSEIVSGNILDELGI